MNFFFNMLKMLPAACILLFICVGVRSSDYDDGKVWHSSDKSGWVDPSDLHTRKDEEGELSKLSRENEQLRRRILEFEGASVGAVVPVSTDRMSCERSTEDDDGRRNNEIVVFKHLLRRLSTKFSSPGSYVANVRVSPRVSSLWREFLSTSRTAETKTLHDIVESVSELFTRVKQDDTSHDFHAGFFEGILDFLRSCSLLLNFCILVPAIALLLVHILRVSRFQLTMWILFLLFFISVIWTWIHLYKERQAEIQARFARIRKISDSCTPETDVPAWQALKKYISSWFYFKPDDPCVEHFKDIMIDPVWTVSPLEAVAVAVTKFFVRPMEPLAEGLHRFWRALLKDLPVTAYCVVLPCMGVSAAFLILALCGYRLRLGFGLLTVEPSGRSSLVLPRLTVSPDVDRIQPAVTWDRGHVSPRNPRTTVRVRRRSVS